MKTNNFQMKLYRKPFELIRSGRKTIEVRCYDEKRKQIKKGDYIAFTNCDNPDDKIDVIVEDIAIFRTFEELYRNYPTSMFGNPEASVTDMVAAVNRIYPEEEQLRYGAVAIKVRVVNH